MKRRNFIGSAAVGALSAGMFVANAANAQTASTSRSVTPEDFGAKGDDVTDDTSSIQSAVDHCVATGASLRIFRTKAAYRLTAPVTVNGPIVVYGEGCSPYTGDVISNVNTRGPGSWFHLAHTGVGFSLRATSGELTGVVFDGIGTFRDHPVPGSGWSPVQHDYDFYCASENGDYRWSNVVVLNPWQAFYLNGRCILENVRGQPLKTGIYTNICGDTCRFSKVHFWPFWSQHSSVKNYQLANGRAYWLHRTDNPSITDCFSLWYFAGICVSQNSSGTVSKLRTSDSDFDSGVYGILVDSTVTSGASIQVSNLTTQTEEAMSSGIGLYVQGNNNSIDLVNFASSQNIQNAVRIDGNANFVRMTNARAVNWNISGSGFPAVEVSSGNSVVVTGGLQGVGGGSALLYGGEGSISADLGKGDFTGTADGNGLVTVTHTARAVPRFIQLTLRAPDSAIYLRVDAATSTSFTVKCYLSGGQNAVGPVRFFWVAHL